MANICHRCLGGNAVMVTKADGKPGLIICPHCEGTGAEMRLTFWERMAFCALLSVGCAVAVAMFVNAVELLGT